MAILKNGLLGGITGKLGNTVCYMLNGQQVVRMIVKTDKPPTEKQLLNRAEMTVVNGFLGKLVEVIRLGYGPAARGTNKSAYNLAVSYTRKHALSGERPHRHIDYALVKLSQGDLAGLELAEVVLEHGELKLRWSRATGNRPNSSTRDRVVLVACTVPQGAHGTDAAWEAYYDLCGTERELGEAVLKLPEETRGRAIEVYAFAMSTDGRKVSYSQYLGRLE